METLPSDEALVAASKAEGAIFGAIFTFWLTNIVLRVRPV